MDITALVFVGAFVICAILIVWLSIRLDRARQELMRLEQTQKRRIFEITTLKAIQDRIGYSLDTQQVIDTVTSSLKHLIPYSTVASLVIQPDRLRWKITLDESLNSSFVHQVRSSMRTALSSLSEKTLPIQLDEERLGAPIDETVTSPVRSFFQIPLVVSGHVVGLINVSSTHPGLYKEADMTILYQITSLASDALTRLRSVIDTEQGKIMALITSLHDGIVMVDTQNRLTLINDAARSFLGITRSDPTIFDILTPLSEKGDFGLLLQSVMREKKEALNMELSVSNHILQATITPVFGPGADLTPLTVIGAAVLLHDITSERELNRLREDFTSSIVHELRSPLTALKASAELMLDDHDKLDSDQRTKLLTIMKKQSMRMLSDINSLLDAAKVASGHLAVFAHPTELVTLCEETVSLFRAEAKEKGVELIIDIQKDIPHAHIDGARIEQVIGNLISNALKFTPSGGTIILKVRFQHNTYLPETPTNPGILVSVSDTGVGIPQAAQSQLFTRFAHIEHVGQVHGSEGTGLGLYIAKGIVEAHKGNMFVQSIPGHGTTVSFTIPIAQEVQLQPVSTPLTAAA